MAKLNPIKTITVSDYAEFKDTFDIKNELEAGPDGSDEELIEEALENESQFKGQTWVIVYQGDGSKQERDYFELNLMIENGQNG